MTYTLVRRQRVHMLDLNTFAGQARLHPDLVRRLVALGLLEAERDPTDDLWLAPAQLATAARIQRLRAGFSLNYAAVGLVMDLLDRIEELEATLRRTPRQTPTRTARKTTITTTMIGG